MTMLSVHADAMERNTAYHEFLLFYKRTANVVYGFVEGSQDPSFFRGLIDSCLPGGWRAKLFQAGNRDKVVRTCLEMDWNRFDTQRVCFFIDRDLTAFFNGSDILPPNIYVTDQYSIENDVVTQETLGRVLEEVFNIVGLTPGEESTIQELFVAEYSKFCEAMAAPMSQILIWRRNGYRACLDNVRLKDWFEFVSGKIAFKGEYWNARARLEYVANRCSCVMSPDELLLETEKEFRHKDGVQKYVRGKYVLWFFVQFVTSIYESVSAYCARYAKKPKIHVSLGIENAMVILGGRVRSPESLHAFMTATYIAYIAGVPESQGNLSLGA
ncbi:MAG: DUF4435 domain-containing protein [Sulfuriferula sp.]